MYARNFNKNKADPLLKINGLGLNSVEKMLLCFHWRFEGCQFRDLWDSDSSSFQKAFLFSS